MNGIFHDLRYGVRMLSTHPGFTLIAVLTLALGIGANSTIFSVAYGVLFKPLPYESPDRLVRMFEESSRHPRFPIAPGNFIDYRDNVRSFDELAVYVRSDAQLTVGDRPEQLAGMAVSSGFFRLLGVAPLLGREFTREEELAGNRRVVVLGHDLWLRAFGGASNIVGETIELSGETHTVVGVLPAGFQHVGGRYRTHGHGEVVDVWRPKVLGPEDQPRNQHYLNGIAKLREGVTREQAEQDTRAIALDLAERYPDQNTGWSANLMLLEDEIVGSAQPALLVLLGAVGLVLLIACVNVANLMLAQAATRKREIAVRSALGAGRIRLLRQLLSESMLIAVLGGGLGLLFAVWGVEALVALAADGLPRVQMITVDVDVVAFTTLISLLTGLLFGIVPALQASNGNLNEALKDGDRSGTGGRRQQALRRTLVTAEIALAFVLLVGAGLLLRSFLTLQAVDPGFRPREVLSLNVALPEARYGTDDDVVAFQRQLVERVSALPGVRSVGGTSDLPWTGYDENSGFRIPGRTFPPNERPGARYHFRTPGYFRTIGVPLLAGRDFDWSDDREAQPVVLINESLARRYWGPGTSDDPVGTTMDLWGAERTIVGIVGDIKDRPSDFEAAPAFYFPFSQMTRSEMILTVSTATEATALIGPIRRLVQDLDSELPVFDIRKLDDVASGAVAGRRFTLILVTVFAASALFLALVGVYGMMSWSVSQRQSELGIRMALGAQRRQLMRMVMMHGLRVSFFGAVMGIVGALLAGRLISGLLYGVGATDLNTLVAVAGLIVAVAMGACWLPAVRATRVDPMRTLRCE